MDRARDLVAAGNVSVVLLQDRDSFSRRPAYAYLLRREFEEHGCELRSLTDRGDSSPEGDLTDGFLDIPSPRGRGVWDRRVFAGS